MIPTRYINTYRRVFEAMDGVLVATVLQQCSRQGPVDPVNRHTYRYRKRKWILVFETSVGTVMPYFLYGVYSLANILPWCT